MTSNELSGKGTSKTLPTISGFNFLSISKVKTFTFLSFEYLKTNLFPIPISRTLFGFSLIISLI